MAEHRGVGVSLSLVGKRTSATDSGTGNRQPTADGRSTAQTAAHDQREHPEHRSHQPLTCDFKVAEAPGRTGTSASSPWPSDIAQGRLPADTKAAAAAYACVASA
ncbi:hypothetical protein GCM10010344_15630 [Streptomyces bluensis]|nr:hypothetical protein GCM10010344_15630 [Streptomyces bluensis]